MTRRFLVALTFTVIAGCSQDDSSNNASLLPDQANGTLAGQDWSAMSGESAYYMACAACHETGASAAPLSGDRKAWADRSSMWQAVLAEHANKGYMTMPAKGGMLQLSDEVVMQATEYMMTLTYPEMLPDD